MNKTLFPARIAMLASLLALSVPALAIEAFTADYQATALGMQGDGKVVISAQPNNRWQYALTVRNQVIAACMTSTRYSRHFMRRATS